MAQRGKPPCVDAASAAEGAVKLSYAREDVAIVIIDGIEYELRSVGCLFGLYPTKTDELSDPDPKLQGSVEKEE
jgi:hypothetical protein